MTEEEIGETIAHLKACAVHFDLSRADVSYKQMRALRSAVGDPELRLDAEYIIKEIGLSVEDLV